MLTFIYKKICTSGQVIGTDFVTSFIGNNDTGLFCLQLEIGNPLFDIASFFIDLFFKGCAGNDILIPYITGHFSNNRVCEVGKGGNCVVSRYKLALFNN